MRDPTYLYDGKISPARRVLAQRISFIAQAPFLSIPVFVLLCTFSDSAADGIMYASACILFATILPMAVVIYYAKKFSNEDCDIARREDRARPLVLGILSYLAGAAVLFAIGAPRIVWVLMLCYFANTVAVFLVSLKWKISIHAIGCIGPTMALVYAFGWPGALFILILPPVTLSRYFLRKHTPAQLAAGALLGFVLTGAIFAVLL